MTDLPRTTKGGRIYLRRFAAQDVHVYRTPDKPGNGVSRTHLDRLIDDALVTLDDTTPEGQLIRVTELGKQVLHAHPTD
ncbi:hypothetical protein [Nocardia altamirensis]|uniref:hypothetical protein n=1 Tax=Nocardia altamirensis TaxID=472158 RepID=UPI0008403B7C|nr:hypothetical protein [Nocardia altamirensis]